jgi:hypothetical protein
MRRLVARVDLRPGAAVFELFGLGLVGKPLPLPRHLRQKPLEAGIDRCPRFLKASHGKSLILPCCRHSPTLDQRHSWRDNSQLQQNEVGGLAFSARASPLLAQTRSIEFCFRTWRFGNAGAYLRRPRRLLGNSNQRTQNAGRALEPLLRRFPFVEEHDFHIRAHARAGLVLADIGD